jgi:hypothetical protein
LAEILFPALEIKVTPMGIMKISHVPCESLTVTFVAETSATEKELNSKPDLVTWLSLEEYENLEGRSNIDLQILKESTSVYIAPLGLITLEM